jgi:hypothetical protein
MNVKFKQWDCVAVPGKYSNGRKAIQLLDAEDYEVVAVATVNMVSVPDDQMDDDEVFIKDYSENSGMYESLVEAGIIFPEPKSVSAAGWVNVTSYKLTSKALKEIFKE